jgi:hypothetical protein
MARARVQAFARDEAGNKLSGTGYEVRFYQAGTNTLQTLYPDGASVTTISNPHYPNAGVSYSLALQPLTTDTVLSLNTVGGLSIGDFVTFDDNTVRTERCITAINSGLSQITVSLAIGRAYATATTRVNGRENLGHVAAYVDNTADIEMTVKNLSTSIEGPREFISVKPASADWVKLDEVIIGTTAGYLAATGQIDFPTGGGSLNQTYSEFELEIEARVDGAVTTQTVLVRLATGGGAIDAGANYDWEDNLQNGAVTTVPSQGTAVNQYQVGKVSGANSTAGAAGRISVKFPNYSGAVFRKGFQSLYGMKSADGAGGMFVGVASGEWRNTGSITAIRVLAGAGAFIIGSVFRLKARK